MALIREDIDTANRASQPLDDAIQKDIRALLGRHRLKKYRLAFELNCFLGLRIADFLSLRIEDAEYLVAHRPEFMPFEESKQKRNAQARYNKAMVEWQERIDKLVRTNTAKSLAEAEAERLKPPKLKKKPPRMIPTHDRIFTVLKKMIANAKKQGYKVYLMESDAPNRPSETKPLSRQAVAYAFREIDERLRGRGHNVKFSSHSCRKVLARKYQRDGDLVMAQRVLGHASPGTTAAYLNIDLDELKKMSRKLYR